MATIAVLGIDLAKSALSVHGVDCAGTVVLRKSLSRAKLVEVLANAPRCLIGLEACSGAHDLARTLIGLGHDARIMAPKFVIPYRRNQKNDGNDAEAICEAVARPNMRFVPVKSPEQQAVLVIHRVRAELVHSRVALVNQVRGLLTEFGIAFARGRSNFRHLIAAALGSDRLPELARRILADVNARIGQLDREILAYDRQIKALVRSSDAMTRAAEIPGIGPITASAIVASVGDAKLFKSSRSFAAWLGLVPRQYSTGGRTILGRITKQGDVYLRTLLIHGARSALTVLKRQPGGRLRDWALALAGRRGFTKACVAMAAKTARILWAVLSRGERYRGAGPEAPVAA